MTIIHAEHHSVSMRIDNAPLSIQGRKERRNELLASLSSELRGIPFLMSDDVSTTIESFLNEERRYETDRFADIDNVVKPLIDVITGPDGILIDDNQVQHIRNSWVDTNQDEYAIMTVQIMFDGVVQRKGLAFVRMYKQLYFPLNLSYPANAVGLFLDELAHHIETRKKFETAGADYSTIRMMLPIQRLFYKSKIMKFDAYEFQELRQKFPSPEPKQF